MAVSRPAPAKFSLVLRVVLIVVWVLLLGLLFKRDYLVRTLDLREAAAIKRGRVVSFAGIYFRNKRIGYVKNRLTKGGEDTMSLTQEAFFRLNILNEIHPVRLRITALLNNAFLLREFAVSFTSPFYTMRARGEVDGRTISFTLNTGKETVRKTIRLEKPPFLPGNDRAYLLRQHLEPGDRIRLPYFDPLTLSGRDTVIEYRGVEKILIKGRVRKLRRFVETHAGIRINSWLDDQGRVIKEESPAGFVFLAEPEFQATALAATGPELLSAVAVPVTGAPPETKGKSRARYQLRYPPEADLDLAGGRQTVDHGVVTITREIMPPATGAACSGPESALAATAYVQARAPEITELSRELTRGKRSPLEKIQALSAWIYAMIEKRPVIGIPDALTTLASRKGDCNEHASLFAALARSAGIPARIVAGVTCHAGAFYYHAWNEVCIDNAWLSVDTTRNQIPTDLTHIRFVTGGIEQLTRIGALVGNLEIEPLP